jgi:hypothetical protein
VLTSFKLWPFQICQKNLSGGLDWIGTRNPPCRNHHSNGLTAVDDFDFSSLRRLVSILSEEK